MVIVLSDATMPNVLTRKIRGFLDRNLSSETPPPPVKTSPPTVLPGFTELTGEGFFLDQQPGESFEAWVPRIWEAFHESRCVRSLTFKGRGNQIRLWRGATDFLECKRFLEEHSRMMTLVYTDHYERSPVITRTEKLHTGKCNLLPRNLLRKLTISSGAVTNVSN